MGKVMILAERLIPTDAEMYFLMKVFQKELNRNRFARTGD